MMDVLFNTILKRTLPLTHLLKTDVVVKSAKICFYINTLLGWRFIETLRSEQSGQETLGFHCELNPRPLNLRP